MSERMSLEQARGIPDTGSRSDIYRATRTIVACGDVLEKVRAEYTSLHRQSRPNISAHTDGYLLALDIVEQWLEQALNPEAPPHGGASSMKEQP